MSETLQGHQYNIYMVAQWPGAIRNTLGAILECITCYQYTCCYLV